DPVLEERDEQLLLRLEVEIDRAVRHAGGLGDLAHARRVEAVPREDLHRRVQDAVALVSGAPALVVAPPASSAGLSVAVGLRPPAPLASRACVAAPQTE